MGFYGVYQKWLQQMLTENGGKIILTIEGDILEYMAATDLLMPGEVETIKHCVTPLSKNNALLLKILPGKGAKGFDGFVQALTLNGYEYLVAGLIELAKKLINYAPPNASSTVTQALPMVVTDSKAVDDLVKKIAELEKSLVSPTNETSSKAKEQESQQALQPSGIIKNMEVKLTHTPDIELVDSAYPNFTRPKGLVLIINNRTFTDESFKKRDGTDVDVVNIIKLFSSLGYEILLEQDLTAEGIRIKLKQFAENEMHKQTSSAAVFVLSHGEDGVIFGTDGEEVLVSYIIDSLNARNCRNLQGKPKVFIIQACRGERSDTGSVESDGPAKREKDKEESDEVIKKLATDADILVGYATTPGYVSWRDTRTGTWYIEILCQVFSKKAATRHVSDMLTEVNRLVGEKESKGHCKSMSQIVSQLTRDFYFFPGYYK